MSAAPKKKARVVFDVGDDTAGGAASAAAGAGSSASAPAAPAAPVVTAAAAAAAARKAVGFSEAPAAEPSDAGLAVQDLATLDIAKLTPLSPDVLSRQVRLADCKRSPAVARAHGFHARARWARAARRARGARFGVLRAPPVFAARRALPFPRRRRLILARLGTWHTARRRSCAPFRA
jgi:hypothetical protein